MSINIEAIQPIKVGEENQEIYVTHFVANDTAEDVYLVADYSENPVSLWPARINLEEQRLEPVTEELATEIRDHIELFPITLVPKEVMA